MPNFKEMCKVQCELSQDEMLIAKISLKKDPFKAIRIPFAVIFEKCFPYSTGHVMAHKIEREGADNTYWTVWARYGLKNVKVMFYTSDKGKGVMWELT